MRTRTFPESISQESESEAESTIEADEEGYWRDEPEVEEVGELPVEEQAEEPEPEPELKTEEAPAEEEPASPGFRNRIHPPPEPIPDDILENRPCGHG